MFRAKSFTARQFILSILLFSTISKADVKDATSLRYDLNLSFLVESLNIPFEEKTKTLWKQRTEQFKTEQKLIQQQIDSFVDKATLFPMDERFDGLPYPLEIDNFWTSRFGSTEIYLTFKFHPQNMSKLPVSGTYQAGSNFVVHIPMSNNYWATIVAKNYDLISTDRLRVELIKAISIKQSRQKKDSESAILLKTNRIIRLFSELVLAKSAEASPVNDTTKFSAGENAPARYSNYDQSLDLFVAQCQIKEGRNEAAIERFIENFCGNNNNGCSTTLNSLNGCKKGYSEAALKAITNTGDSILVAAGIPAELIKVISKTTLSDLKNGFKGIVNHLSESAKNLVKGLNYETFQKKLNESKNKLSKIFNTAWDSWGAFQKAGAKLQGEQVCKFAGKLVEIVAAEVLARPAQEATKAAAIALGKIKEGTKSYLNFLKRKTKISKPSKKLSKAMDKLECNLYNRSLELLGD